MQAAACEAPAECPQFSTVLTVAMQDCIGMALASSIGASDCSGGVRV